MKVRPGARDWPRGQSCRLPPRAGNTRFKTRPRSSTRVAIAPSQPVISPARVATWPARPIAFPVSLDRRIVHGPAGCPRFLPARPAKQPPRGRAQQQSERPSLSRQRAHLQLRVRPVDRRAAVRDHQIEGRVGEDPLPADFTGRQGQRAIEMWRTRLAKAGAASKRSSSTPGRARVQMSFRFRHVTLCRENTRRGRAPFLA